MELSKLMRKGVRTVGVDESAEEAWNRMKGNGIRHLVVLRNGKVAGVLSERDLAGERGEALREGRTAGRMMTPMAITATPATTVQEAAGILRGRTIGCLPILEDGELRGIVTTSDLLDLLARSRRRERKGEPIPTDAAAGT
jgi:acetoin utilization protein AcuB